MAILIFIITFFILKSDRRSLRIPFSKANCGIENCHGLNISCGDNVPEVCSEIYMLGDFCRQYAKCDLIGGECQFVKSKQFEECKACVEDCVEKFQGEEAFQCEEECRIKL